MPSGSPISNLSAAALLSAALTAAGGALAQQDAGGQPPPDGAGGPAGDRAGVEGFANCPENAVVRVLVIGGINGIPTEGTFPLYWPSVGHGSGAVISRDGLILTARHVVEGATGVAVWLPGAERPIAAAVVYVDKDADLAFLKVDAAFKARDVLPLAEADTGYRRGDEVISWGYPLDVKEPTPDLLRGNVRKVENREGDLEVSCQFDQGISGGPVCSQKGIIGIVKAIEGRGQNYALPIAPVLAAYEREIGQKRLDKAVAKEMRGAEWGAYQRYAELSAQMLYDMPELDEIPRIAKWLKGDQQYLDAGSTYYREYDRLRRIHDLPEAKLVLAAFFWNDAAISAWSRDCNDFPCLNATERRYVVSSFRLVLAAVQQKPALEERGGTAVRAIVDFVRSSPDGGAELAAELEDGSASMPDGIEPEDSPPACGDGLDNDGDYTWDCDDAGCRGVGDCRGGGAGRAGAWENQFVAYGGLLFPTPIGGDTGVDLWGVGLLYQRRIWGWSAAKYLRLDLVVGVDGFLHSWGDALHDAAGADTRIPRGIGFALDAQPTVRLVVGREFGLVAEGYYPLTVLFADPVSFCYKVWGFRAGLYFKHSVTIGIQMHQLVPDGEADGVWGLMIMAGF